MRCNISNSRGLATLLLLLTLLFAGPLRAWAETPRNILLLNSYHEGFKGTDDIVAGFRAVVNEAVPGTNIKTEYLDSQNFSGPAYDEQVVALLRHKYRGHHFDLLVISDDYAFNLVEKYYDELFAPIPVVFCGTNAFEPQRIAEKNRFVGVDERPSFRETVELIRQLRPQTRRMVVIHDSSLVGQINSEEFRTATAGLVAEVDFTYLAGLELEELQAKVQALPADTVAIYFASFVLNRAGKSYSSGAALELLAAKSPVPIFGGWEFSLGHGIVGGKLVNLHEHGTLAGRLAVRIFKGEEIAALPKLSPSPNQFMFDQQELLRFHIKDALLPAGSMVVNRLPSFYQRNRAEIFIALSVALVLVVICSFIVLYQSRRNLQRAYREQLAVEKSLREKQAELTLALGEIKQLSGFIPICSSCKSIRDDQGFWQRVEKYISERSDAQFSHSICPDCAKKLYADILDEDGNINIPGT